MVAAPPRITRWMVAISSGENGVCPVGLGESVIAARR